jgi:AraC-like DNA-binding protein
MARVKTEPPRGVLKTEIADPGRYYHIRYHASPDLALYVEHYWSVGWDLRGVAPERIANLPHPSVHLTFERKSGGTVMGVNRGRFERRLRGQGRVLGIKFTPGGFQPFSRVPVSRLTDSTMTVRQVFGAAGDRLKWEVLAAEQDAERVQLIEAFLRTRMPKPDANVGRVSEIVYSVLRDRSVLRVEDLVSRYGLPKRTLQRLFARYVGVTPKWVIQRYRLHEAAEQLARDPSVNQPDLALALGYSDQAHFIRDFKRIVGMSPAAYARAATAASV